MKDTILNAIIRWCAQRCCLDSYTCRMFIHKMSKAEIKYYFDEYDEAEVYWKGR